MAHATCATANGDAIFLRPAIFFKRFHNVRMRDPSGSTRVSSKQLQLGTWPHVACLRRLDSDAQELKDTIARVARLVLEREHESRLSGQARQACNILRGYLSACCNVCLIGRMGNMT